jgi:aminoglycoside phosphotransferase (APT) family kinase protein
VETTEWATAIAQSVGVSAARVSALQGGNENHVVRVTGDGRDLVVRFAKDADRMVTDPFDVEAWCLLAAAAAGIPTSHMVARGRLKGRSYLVTEYVDGETASPNDLVAWRSIGRLASALARIDVADAPETLFSRFGRDPDGAWVAHIDYNRAALTVDDPLLVDHVYQWSDRSRLLDSIDSLRRRSLPQGLVHGDMSTRNLVKGDGYTLIDWGATHAGPAVWGDLEQIHRWKVLDDAESPVSDAAWANVLEGSGLTDAEAAPILRELTVLHALDVLRWAMDVRPERLPELTAQSTALLRAVL